MDETPSKITRNILTYEKLTLKIHVKIKHDEGTIHNEYTFDDKKYLRIENRVFLTLDLMETGEWDTNKSILITQLSISQVIKGFKKIIRNIYTQPIFGRKPNGEIVSYLDEVNKNTITVNLLNGAGSIMLRPAVVFDDSEVSYEGITLFINKKSTYINLPIEVLEGILYTMESIDMFQYSQLLMNYYISCYGQDSLKFTKPTKPKINFNDNTPTDQVSSNFVRREVDSTTTDLFGGLV